MADQPATPPAADPTNPQVPGQQPVTPPADAPAAQSTITLTDDQKSYLKGQGLSDADLASPDALSKIIGHAQSSQKTAAQLKADLDKLQPATPQVPGQLPTVPQVPADPANPQPPATPPSDPNPAPSNPTPGLDPVTAYNLSANLAGQFPELKDNLMDGSFYKDMQALGVPLVANGQVNLQGILGYGKLAQERAQTAAKLEELSKPPEGAIPDANPTTPQQPAADAPMTGQIARAILAQDPNHPRAAEAKAFVQEETKKKV